MALQTMFAPWVLLLVKSACGTQNNTGDYVAVKIRAVQGRLETDTEDSDGTDEVSLWIRGGENLQDYVKTKGQGYNYWDEPEYNFYKKEFSKAGDTRSFTGKWQVIKAGQEVYMHVMEHDTLINDATEWNDVEAMKTPEITAERIDQWIEVFNAGIMKNITLDYTFKLSTYGMDDLPFQELTTAFGFPEWVIDLALDQLCMNALDLAIMGAASAASGGAAPLAYKVAAKMGQTAYKSATKKVARDLVKEGVSEGLYAASSSDPTQGAMMALGFMDGVLDKTEFCLFPSLAKDKSDPIYVVTLEVVPITEEEEKMINHGVSAHASHGVSAHRIWHSAILFAFLVPLVVAI